MKDEYKNPYGTWIVTTEGDCEGRTTKQLGTHTGYLDEIALHLADKCTYSLQFTHTQLVRNFQPKRNWVNITFGYDSGFEKNPTNIRLVSEIFANRPVTVEDGQYYGSIKLRSHNEIDIIRQQALEKLTEEEKTVLGFKFGF